MSVLANPVARTRQPAAPPTSPWPAARSPRRARARLGRALAFGLLVLGPSGCQPGPPREGRKISREEFVEAYEALLRAEAAAQDSAEARQRRAWALERRNLTPQDLERFARKHSHDPEYMAELWREIEARVREPAPEDTSPRGRR